MNAFKVLAAGFVVLAVTQSVWAQAGGGAGAGGAGQAGAGQPGAAGQPGSVGTGMTFGGISQTPWFANQGVRSQFKVTDQQFNTLNQAYGNAFIKYQTGVNQLSNLPEAQRAQQLQQLQAQFNQSVTGAANTVFTDPQQRARYNQLNLQFQGFGAFTDPMIQQNLNLTDAQRRQMAQFGTEWNQQMGTLNAAFQKDPSGTSERFNQLMRARADRINQVLTPEQRRSWEQMTGSAYTFPADVYFLRGGTTGTTTTTTPPK